MKNPKGIHRQPEDAFVFILKELAVLIPFVIDERLSVLF